MGFKIKISTGQTEWYADSMVEGTVKMEVNTAYDEALSARKLMVQLLGVIKTSVDGERRHSSTRTITIHSDEKELASFGGRAGIGTYEFPFSFTLPSDMPPSMEERGRSGKCSILYSLEARLGRYTLLGKVVCHPKCKLHLKVLGARPHAVSAAVPLLVGPKTRAVFSFVGNTGTMTIGYLVDRPVVGIGETVGLNIVASNDSSTTVAHVSIRIEQITTWSGRGGKGTKTRVLAELILGSSEFGVRHRAAGADNQRGQSVADVAENTRARLQEQLSASMGSRHEISVPPTSLLTLKTETIEVKHELSVKLKTTSAFTTSHDVRTPLHIRPPMTSTVGVQAMGEPLAPPLAEAVQHARAMFAAGSAGYDSTGSNSHNDVERELPLGYIVEPSPGEVPPQTAVALDSSEG